MPDEIEPRFIICDPHIPDGILRLLLGDIEPREIKREKDQTTVMFRSTRTDKEAAKARIREYEQTELAEIKRIEKERRQQNAAVLREAAIQRQLEEVEARRHEWEPKLRAMGLPID